MYATKLRPDRGCSPWRDGSISTEESVVCGAAVRAACRRREERPLAVGNAGTGDRIRAKSPTPPRNAPRRRWWTDDGGVADSIQRLLAPVTWPEGGDAGSDWGTKP